MRVRRVKRSDQNLIFHFPGTWKSKPGEVEHAVEYALKHGYKSIDSKHHALLLKRLVTDIALVAAAAYQNEAEVGQGIKASGVARESFFLTTKLDNPDQGRAPAALEDSLRKLGTSYLDLWLMHWPAPMTREGGPDRSIDWLDTWKEMEKLYEAHPDKLRAIGESASSLTHN